MRLSLSQEKGCKADPSRVCDERVSVIMETSSSRLFGLE